MPKNVENITDLKIVERYKTALFRFPVALICSADSICRLVGVIIVLCPFLFRAFTVAAAVMAAFFIIQHL